MECCCKSLKDSVERGEIVYSLPEGCFWFYFKRDYDDSFGLYRLGYCPFCGKELPQNHTFLFEEILEKKYNIELCNVDPHDPTTYPEEFQKDDWWKVYEVRKN